MKRFLVYLAIALVATIPGLWLRLTGRHPGALIEAAIFGGALLAAGFILSWGAEAAEGRVSQGLLLAGLALVTVLPEFAVDIYYAFRAGQAPGSDYIHYAAANMTGANRLLIGFAWPLVVFLHWYKTRKTAVELLPSNRIELFFLALASAYAFVILFKGRIDLIDFGLLLAIFGAYLWRLALNRKPKLIEEEDDDDEEPGPAAALESLSPQGQWAWTAGLTALAGAVILIGAEPFAESMIASGRILGIDEFLLIQWVAPLTGEAPELVLAVLFVFAARASSGLIALISDKINQWTLLVGALPVAMSIGAGSIIALPLSARQHEEFFLTAAQSLFAISLLLGLRLSVVGATLLIGLFTLQLGLAFAFQQDPPREIVALTILGWVYIALAIASSSIHAARLLRLRTGRAI
ncbi:MAG: sodium:proton exchanger [Sphingomonas sp.]|nr:sodium:proton exchanger [Sphingomonas sp.]